MQVNIIAKFKTIESHYYGFGKWNKNHVAPGAKCIWTFLNKIKQMGPNSFFLAFCDFLYV